MMSLHFIRPWWFLALIPLLGCWLLAKKQQQAKHNWNKVCDPHLLPHLLVGKNSESTYLPWVLLGVLWFIAVLALAGPAWKKLPQPVYTQNINRVVVFDLSNDMQGRDLLPSRLVRARYKLLDLFKQIQEGQTGLVVYSAEPYVVSPLTEDTHTMAAMVSELSPSIMPAAGNNLAAGLSKAATLLKQAGVGEAQVIVFTAGGADPEAIKEASKLEQQGYQVSVLGIGTSNKTPLMLSDGQFAKNTKGDILFTQLNVASLQKLAQAGQGLYITFRNDNSDINSLLNQQKLKKDLQKQQEKATTNLWQDEGIYFIWLLIPFALIAFRRNWLGGLR